MTIRGEKDFKSGEVFLNACQCVVVDEVGELADKWKLLLTKQQQAGAASSRRWRRAASKKFASLQ